MAKYECKRNKLFILSYYNKLDDTKNIEIGPFIMKNQKFIIAYDDGNPICTNWKTFKNIFNYDLISIINPQGLQNQKIQTTALLNSKMDDKEPYIESSIIIYKMLNSIEVILKMPDEFRIKLLEKEVLEIRDILSIYDFAYNNAEILNLYNNIDNNNEKHYAKKNN